MNNKPNPFDLSKKKTPDSAEAKRTPGNSGRESGVSDTAAAEPLVPGEIVYGDGDVEINAGLPGTTINVTNTADRPIQIGSHYHFAEANEALEFDRTAAWGKRLDVLSGGSVRFEPGTVVEIDLVPIRGRRVVPGLRGLCGGPLDE